MSVEPKRKLTKSEIKQVLSFIKPNPNIPKEIALAMARNMFRKLKKQLGEVAIYPRLIPELTKELSRHYRESQIQAGECVGILGAQSIGEKNTQANLNSVDWEEKVIYAEGKTSHIRAIGEWIDAEIARDEKNTQHIPENNTYYLELKDRDIYIPSCDQHGMCNWYRVKAVTKHYPKGKLVKVITQSGRSVVATQAKSFLVWNGTEFCATPGSDVKVGDIMPTTKRLSRYNRQTHFSLRTIFPHIEVPEQILLDNNFGFLIGIYLAEGWVTETFVGISNNDPIIRKRVTDWCDRYGITYHVGKGTNNDLKIHSTLITGMFKIICDTGSTNKRVPTFSYMATDEFLRGMIDGYFSGDGTIDKNYGNITVTSVSENLILGISFLLSYFGIFGRMSNNIDSKNIKRTYELCISNGFARKFAQTIPLTSSSKQERLDITLSRKYRYEHGKSQEGFPDRDVYFDEVVSVEYVDGTTEFVYDLTVETTRNFQLWNGLNQHDTFHKAGSGDGRPQAAGLNELLNATKEPKTPGCLVYFNGGNKSIGDLRTTIGSSLVQITFGKITSDYDICIDKKSEVWYPAYKLLEGDDFEDYTDCISIKVDMDLLFTYKITLKEIAEFISNEYSDMLCVYSPDCFGQLDIFVDTREIDIPEEQIVHITTENAREIYIDDVVRPNLMELVICGIPGVDNMYFLRDSEQKGCWGIELENTREKLPDSVRRYKQILAHPIVDMSRTISNNVWDIYHTLGIEAARQYILEISIQMMEGINLCHPLLLVDKMTHAGTISSISRYTMRREESGPFGKASFEETLDNFLKAGVYGQQEPTRGVSASIICGKTASIGTGLCELRMNMDMLLGTVEEEDAKESDSSDSE